MASSPFAIVLAAGKASRFGAPKQLAEIGGEPLVRRSVRLANAVFGERTLLVTGHEWQAVAAACADLQGFMIINESVERGIGRSLARAVVSLAEVADGVMMLLADQPRITAGHLAELVARWDGSHEHIVATAFAGTRGPPVLFPRNCFAELARLDGDRGARQLIDEHRFRVTTVRCEDAALDVDLPEDLRQI